MRSSGEWYRLSRRFKNVRRIALAPLLPRHIETSQGLRHRARIRSPASTSASRYQATTLASDASQSKQVKAMASCGVHHVPCLPAPFLLPGRTALEGSLLYLRQSFERFAFAQEQKVFDGLAFQFRLGIFVRTQDPNMVGVALQEMQQIFTAVSSEA